MKGHVDADKDRTEESYTQAERMNIRADELATKYMEAQEEAIEPEEPLLQVVEGAVEADTCGTWALPCAQEEGVSHLTTLDDPIAAMPARAAERALSMYWKTRSDRRLKEGLISAEQNQAAPTPIIDERVMKPGGAGKETVKDWGEAIFRSKLWWDHLPSQQVINRGAAHHQSGGGGAQRHNFFIVVVSRYSIIRLLT